jgi:hypothetical protein
MVAEVKRGRILGFWKPEERERAVEDSGPVFAGNNQERLVARALRGDPIAFRLKIGRDRDLWEGFAQLLNSANDRLAGQCGEDPRGEANVGALFGFQSWKNGVKIALEFLNGRLLTRFVAEGANLARIQSELRIAGPVKPSLVGGLAGSGLAAEKQPGSQN